MLLSAFADTHITDDDRRTPAMLAELHGHTELLPYLRCTLSYSPGIVEHVSNNNNSVSISLVSVEDVTQHNTPHTNSSRPGTTSKSTKRANMRVV
jgi:ankyrin repeat protein